MDFVRFSLQTRKTRQTRGRGWGGGGGGGGTAIVPQLHIMFTCGKVLHKQTVFSSPSELLVHYLRDVAVTVYA